MVTSAGLEVVKYQLFFKIRSRTAFLEYISYISIDAKNCLAGHSKVSSKNHAMEHPGKGMKPRHIPTKV